MYYKSRLTYKSSQSADTIGGHTKAPILKFCTMMCPNPYRRFADTPDSWFHTGDMALIDGEGFIEVVDRKKDLIISGGENVSSIEVEGLLYK